METAQKVETVDFEQTVIAQKMETDEDSSGALGAGEHGGNQ